MVIQSSFFNIMNRKLNLLDQYLVNGMLVFYFSALTVFTLHEVKQVKFLVENLISTGLYNDGKM